MKLIIDTEPRYYKNMQSDVKELYYEAINRITEAVRHGIPYKEPAGDLISRDALKKAIMNDLGLGDEENGSDAEYMSGLQDCYKLIDNASAVESYTAEQVKDLVNLNKKLSEEKPRGEWIKWNFKTFGAMGNWEYKCSNCEKVYGGEYNFCPNCGADMRGEE